MIKHSGFATQDESEELSFVIDPDLTSDEVRPVASAVNNLTEISAEHEKREEKRSDRNILFFLFAIAACASPLFIFPRSIFLAIPVVLLAIIYFVLMCLSISDSTSHNIKRKLVEAPPGKSPLSKRTQRRLRGIALALPLVPLCFFAVSMEPYLIGLNDQVSNSIAASVTALQRLVAGEEGTQTYLNGLWTKELPRIKEAESRGDISEAINRAENVLSLFKANQVEPGSWIYFVSGGLYDRTGQYSRAEESYKKGEQSIHKNYKQHANQMWINMSKNRFNRLDEQTGSTVKKEANIEFWTPYGYEESKLAADNPGTVRVYLTPRLDDLRVHGGPFGALYPVQQGQDVVVSAEHVLDCLRRIGKQQALITFQFAEPLLSSEEAITIRSRYSDKALPGVYLFPRTPRDLLARQYVILSEAQYDKLIDMSGIARHESVPFRSAVRGIKLYIPWIDGTGNTWAYFENSRSLRSVKKISAP